MTTTDEFRTEVDRLHGPDLPDLAGVRRAGLRSRRRRQWTGALAAGACVTALAVPLLALVGDDGPTTVQDAPFAIAPTPSFGEGMEAAVASTLPGATQTDESLGDRWEWQDDTNLRWTAGDPVRWETLFAWSQYYDLPGGVLLDVVALRESPSPVVDPASYGYCRDGLYVVERSCTTDEVDGRAVVVHDGTQSRGQADDTWLRTVEVWGPDEMASHTSVSVVATGDTWADAAASMPSVEELTELALDGRLVLPEPDRYPRQFPQR